MFPVNFPTLPAAVKIINYQSTRDNYSTRCNVSAIMRYRTRFLHGLRPAALELIICELQSQQNQPRDFFAFRCRKLTLHRAVEVAVDNEDDGQMTSVNGLQYLSLIHI